MQNYQYDSCLNPRDELLLAFLGRPTYFSDEIKSSQLPFGEAWLSLLQFRDGLCHVCNSQNPDYRYSASIYESDFKKQWGHYMRSRYFHYGIDEREYWGVYFVEEALSIQHKKMLCPTKDEMESELGGYRNELDRLFALPKVEFEAIVYYRTKTKVLRDKKILTSYDLACSLNMDEEFMQSVYSIVHKRFLAVRKSIRDELKKMIPKEEKTFYFKIEQEQSYIVCES
ncbi:hypothetical protein LJC42_02235 [Eubacteriales bacterium OttesenSCG-928-K08]|nr:hypothetical protein [Eubacteriales bacterium OttesenSCG-928-K08]